MRPADVGRLLLLAAIWGNSFIFIRVIAPALGPIVTAASRVLIAGFCLLIYSRAIQTNLHLREFWKSYLFIGAVGSALPFYLISVAELRLTASMAVILNATSPLFGAVISEIWLKETLTRKMAMGIAIAVSGVVILVGWSPMPLTMANILAITASLSAACAYGLTGAYTRARLRGAPAVGMAVGSQISAGLVMLPIVPFNWPSVQPSIAVVFCVMGLSILCTAAAYILYYRLVVDVGPTRSLTVTFLTPIFGVAWGALFLHESITVPKLAACGVILIGTAFVTETSLKSMGIKTKVRSA